MYSTLEYIHNTEMGYGKAISSSIFGCVQELYSSQVLYALSFSLRYLLNFHVVNEWAFFYDYGYVSFYISFGLFLCRKKVHDMYVPKEYTVSCIHVCKITTYSMAKTAKRSCNFLVQQRDFIIQCIDEIVLQEFFSHFKIEVTKKFQLFFSSNKYFFH